MNGIIEYLWHFTCDTRSQFWPKTGRQKYLTSPTTLVPDKFIGEGSKGRIVAPPDLSVDVLPRRGILKAGYAVTQKGYYHNRRENDYNALTIVAKGKMQVSYNGIKREAKVGDMLAIPKNCSCQENVPYGQCCVYWMHLDTRGQWDLGTETSVKKSKNFKDIACIFEMYAREVYSPSRSILYLESLADLLAELLKREFERPIKALNKTDLDLYLDKMSQNLGKDYNRETAAKYFNCAPNLLDSLCLKLYSLSFSKILLKMRMKKALELLHGKSMPFSEIANKVGYSNTSSLSKAFKAYYGKSLRNF